MTGAVAMAERIAGEIVRSELPLPARDRAAPPSLRLAASPGVAPGVDSPAAPLLRHAAALCRAMRGPGTPPVSGPVENELSAG